MLRQFQPQRVSEGYTLVELIVAAAIIASTVLVLAGVVRQGNGITALGQHRLRARAIIDSCFESPAYHFSNYVNVMSVNATRVAIDDRVGRNGNDTLSGTLTVTVAMDTNKTALVGNTPSDRVEFKRVTMAVIWAEPSGNESVTLEKLITKL